MRSNMTEITVDSVTQAMKARDILRAAGWRSEVRRRAEAAANGCTYQLLTEAPKASAMRLLVQKGILHEKGG